MLSMLMVPKHVLVPTLLQQPPSPGSRGSRPTSTRRFVQSLQQRGSSAMHWLPRCRPTLLLLLLRRRGDTTLS
jgi:hypothetical protein